jgi:hypothetical protein
VDLLFDLAGKRIGDNYVGFIALDVLECEVRVNLRGRLDGYGG